MSAPQSRSSRAVDKQGYLIKYPGAWVNVLGVVKRSLLAATINGTVVCRCTVAQTQMQERGPTELGDPFALVDSVELSVDLPLICRGDVWLGQDL